MPNSLHARKKDDVIQIQGILDWQYGQDPVSGKWLAICDPFQICIQADSLTDLKEDMSESIDTLFDEMFDTGEFDAFLQEHGWGHADPLPKRKRAGRIVFDVPQRTRRMTPNDLKGVLC